MTHDYSFPLTANYLQGVGLAVKAVSDAYLVIDGPDCVNYIAESFHPNHDWNFTRNGPPFISTTRSLAHLAMGDESRLERSLRWAASQEDARLIVVAAFALAALTGHQYRPMLDSLQAEYDLPFVDVPSRDFHDDWFHGYQDTLTRMAQRIALSPDPEGRDPEGVALIGYLYDRDEGDHRGNLTELTRLLEKLGIRVVSTWLSGGSLSELRQVTRASRLVALPYGVKAAQALATRLEIPVTEAPLPLGLDATGAFLRIVAAAFGKEAEAEALIEQEERAVLPLLRLVQPQWFQDRRVTLSADPHTLGPLGDFCAFMGMTVAARFANTHPGPELELLTARDGVAVSPRNTLQSIHQTLSDLHQSQGVDLCIGDTLSLVPARELGVVTLEFGFPSFFTHHFMDTPFMGYRGFLGLVERIANAQAQQGFSRYTIHRT